MNSVGIFSSSFPRGTQCQMNIYNGSALESSWQILELDKLPEFRFIIGNTPTTFTIKDCINMYGNHVKNSPTSWVVHPQPTYFHHNITIYPERSYGGIVLAGFLACLVIWLLFRRFPWSVKGCSAPSARCTPTVKTLLCPDTVAKAHVTPLFTMKEWVTVPTDLHHTPANWPHRRRNGSVMTAMKDLLRLPSGRVKAETANSNQLRIGRRSGSGKVPSLTFPFYFNQEVQSQECASTKDYGIVSEDMFT